MPTAKIATCCYCGHRTALVLDKGRHELSCGACGAPLRAMKSLHPVRPAEVKSVPATLPYEKPRSYKKPSERPTRAPKKKRSKTARKLLSKIWDTIEDIWD